MFLVCSIVVAVCCYSYHNDDSDHDNSVDNDDDDDDGDGDIFRENISLRHLHMELFACTLCSCLARVMTVLSVSGC